MAMTSVQLTALTEQTSVLLHCAPQRKHWPVLYQDTRERSGNRQLSVKIIGCDGVDWIQLARDRVQ
jgi:hypothetical protein